MKLPVLPMLAAGVLALAAAGACAAGAGMAKDVEKDKEMSGNHDMKMSKDMPMAMPPGHGMMAPVELACPGIKGKSSMAFSQGEPGTLMLTLGGRSVMLRQAQSASGALYTLRTPEGDTVVWNKGREYRVERPGHAPLVCTEAARGH